MPALHKRLSTTFAKGCQSALVCAALTCALAPPPSFAQEPDRLDRFKAVFMYNFVDFVAWPESASDSLFTFGILGESSITVPLREIAAGKSSTIRKLSVEVFGEIDEIDRCNILFVSTGYASRMEELKRTLGNRNILTIADTPGLGARGVAINFYISDGRLRFEINRESLKRAGLYASSQLLKLATLVEEQKQAVHP